MSGFLIVPDALYDAIHKKLDEEIRKHPDAEKDRDYLYRQCLDYFAEHGSMPNFTLERIQP